MKNKTAKLADSPKAMTPDENDYETQGHLRTLMDAHEITSNPEKMKKVHKLAGRHKKAITSIQDLKDRYADMTKPKAKAILPGMDSDSDGE